MNELKNAEKVINRIKYCIEIDKYSIEYKEEENNIILEM